MMGTGMSTGHHVHDRSVGRVGNEERRLFFHVDSVTTLKDKGSLFSMDLQIPADGTQDFLVPIAGSHETLSLARVEDSVNHVTGMGMEILHAQNIFASLS